MLTGSNCDCLICRLEISLIAELGESQNGETFRQFAASSQVLSGFPTALKLIQHLHRHENENSTPSSDEILLELLRPEIDTQWHPVWQRLFLLVFIPSIHRTTRQITSSFPSLTRDDIAQHLVTVLLESLHSHELRSRRSHLAFAIARMMRRRCFRWAIHQSRGFLREESDPTPTGLHESDVDEENARSVILLRQFFDNCQRRGWLSREERQLLTQCKLEGISCPELARRNGHSAVAIRHRMQRLVDRLRRIAQKKGIGTPEQLDLFPH
jgi:DNA-directed RNA polymerase specialized sigma24 family protein